MQCQLPLSVPHKWAAASPQTDSTAASIPFGCGLAGDHIFFLHKSILFLAVMLQPNTMTGQNTCLDSELSTLLVPFPTIIKGSQRARRQEMREQLQAEETIYQTSPTPESRLNGGSSPNLVDLVERKVPVERKMRAANSFCSFYS